MTRVKLTIPVTDDALGPLLATTARNRLRRSCTLLDVMIAEPVDVGWSDTMDGVTSLTERYVTASALVVR